MKRKESRLSNLDKQILGILLLPGDSYPSSKSIAKKLAIPMTTVQRRRKQLEKERLTICYGMDVSRYGLHKVEFLIATEGGHTAKVAKALLKLRQVTYAGISIGQHTIDLHVETVLKDNTEILEVLETIKGMEGVKDVVWSEVISVVGRKSAVPGHIIKGL